VRDKRICEPRTSRNAGRRFDCRNGRLGHGWHHQSGIPVYGGIVSISAIAKLSRVFHGWLGIDPCVTEAVVAGRQPTSTNLGAWLHSFALSPQASPHSRILISDQYEKRHVAAGPKLYVIARDNPLNNPWMHHSFLKLHAWIVSDVFRELDSMERREAPMETENANWFAQLLSMRQPARQFPGTVKPVARKILVDRRIVIQPYSVVSR
jgi:hypothetical protein